MTIDWSRATVLTAAEFEACWEILHLGETPWQLEPPRHGSTAAARRAFVAEALDRLLNTGPELVEKLRMLARPQWVVDVRLRADRLVSEMAACRGADGVLAVRSDDEMALVEIRAADAVPAVLSLLGPVCPGPTLPVLIATQLRPQPAEAACAHMSRATKPRPQAQSGVGACPPVPNVTQPHPGAHPGAATWPPSLIATQPNLGAQPGACQDIRMFAQLGGSVAARDGDRMRRAAQVIGFHRTGAGDYRSVRVDCATVAVGPATLGQLTADLGELLAGNRARGAWRGGVRCGRRMPGGGGRVPGPGPGGARGR